MPSRLRTCRHGQCVSQGNRAIIPATPDCAGRFARRRRKTDIIMVLTDDQGLMDNGVYGSGYYH